MLPCVTSSEISYIVAQQFWGQRLIVHVDWVLKIGKYGVRQRCLYMQTTPRACRLDCKSSRLRFGEAFVQNVFERPCCASNNVSSLDLLKGTLCQYSLILAIVMVLNW